MRDSRGALSSFMAALPHPADVEQRRVLMLATDELDADRQPVRSGVKGKVTQASRDRSREDEVASPVRSSPTRLALAAVSGYIDVGKQRIDRRTARSPS